MGRRALLSPTYDRTKKRWVLNIPATWSDTGKRKRIAYKTEDEATEEAKRLKRLGESLGARVSRASHDLVETALKYEDVAIEWGFESLAHFCREKFAEMERVGRSPKLSRLIEAFEKDRKHDWSELFTRNRWKPFRKRLDALGRVPIAGMTSDFWREWLAEWREKADPAPSTYNQQVSVLRQLFNHSLARKVHPRNPMDDIPRLKARKADVPTFTAAQVRTILETAAAHDSALVPFFAVCFFAGLRPDSEALRVRFADFLWDEGLLEVRETKTAGVRRFVEIEPALEAWLAPWRRKKGLIVPANFKRRRRWLIHGKYTTPGALPKEPRSWEPLVDWSPDVSRHTYGSMWEAAHRGQAGCREKLAENMGHTSFKTFNQFYRQAQRPDEAAAFWSLRPPSDQSGKMVNIA